MPKYILYLSLIVLTIYTDSPLQNYLDSFGESFVPIVSIFLLSIAYPLGLVKRTDKFIIGFENLIKYTFFVSILALVLYCVDGRLTIKGEFLPLKMIKVMLYFVGYICFLKLMYNIALSLSLEKILKPFLITLILLTFIMIIELIKIPDAFPTLHYHGTPYYRVRLLCSESSWTASQIQVFGIVSLFYSAYVKKSKALSLLVVTCILAHIICSGSKTLLVSVFLFVLLFIAIRLRKSSFKAKIFTAISGALVVLLLFYFILPPLMESFTTDLEEATSTVTRTYTMICAYGIGTVFPFGTGFQTYMDLLPSALKENTWIIDYLFDTANLSEIQELYGGDDGKYLSSKSFLSQSSIYWGILGTIYFLYIIIKRFKRSEKVFVNKGFWLIKGLFFIMLFEISFSSSLSYDFLAFIVVVLVISNDKYRTEGVVKVSKVKEESAKL